MAVKENPYFETKLEPYQDVTNKILSHLWPLCSSGLQYAILGQHSKRTLAKVFDKSRIYFCGLFSSPLPKASFLKRNQNRDIKTLETEAATVAKLQPVCNTEVDYEMGALQQYISAVY